MSKATLILEVTEVKTRNKSILVNGHYLFKQVPGTFYVEVTPDINDERWVLCIGQIDKRDSRDFAVFRTAFELHRGIAWMVTEQKLIWDDLRVKTSREMLDQLDTLLDADIIKTVRSHYSV